jgi:hypothetical protein
MTTTTRMATDPRSENDRIIDIRREAIRESGCDSKFASSSGKGSRLPPLTPLGFALLIFYSSVSFSAGWVN